MSSQELGRGTWLGNTSWYENILVILTVFLFALTYTVVLDFFNFVVFPAPKCSSALADLYIPWLWVPPTNSDWLEGIQSNITDSDLIISFIILFPVSSLISPDMRTLCWIWQFLLPLLASLILFYPLRSFHLPYKGEAFLRTLFLELPAFYPVKSLWCQVSVVWPGWNKHKYISFHLMQNFGRSQRKANHPVFEYYSTIWGRILIFELWFFETE